MLAYIFLIINIVLASLVMYHIVVFGAKYRLLWFIGGAYTFLMCLCAWILIAHS